MNRPKGNGKSESLKDRGLEKRRTALVIGALLATTLLIAFLPQEDDVAANVGDYLQRLTDKSSLFTLPWIKTASAGEVGTSETALKAGLADNNSWWENDIWRDPDRPFHYYGESKDKRPRKAKAPTEPVKTDTREAKPTEADKSDQKPSASDPVDINDFSRFTTLESLKAEREKRLSAAVMNPSPENMASYQAVNAHVLSLSARFAQAWQLSRMAEPQYDFTAVNPSAAFAVTARTEMKKIDHEALLKSLNGQAGLVFVGDPTQPLTEIAAGPVAAFAEMHGLDVLAVAAQTNASEDNQSARPKAGTEVAGFGAFKDVLPDNGRTERWGIRMLPALLLVPSPEAMATRPDFRRLKGGLAGRDGFILATGAVSGEEISRRIALLLGPDTLMTGKTVEAVSSRDEFKFGNQTSAAAEAIAKTAGLTAVP